MMPEFSIVIPFETDNGPRAEMFSWLQAYYTAICPEAEVVSAGDNHAEGELLNRSRMRNRAVAEAHANILIILDSDCLLPRATVMAAVSAVRAQQNSYTVFMLDSVSWLTETATNRIITGAPTFPELASADIRSANFRPLYGLFFALTRATFNALGGFDETFSGWGQEDPAFMTTAKRLGTLQRLPFTGFHLEHPHAVGDGRDNPSFHANTARLQQYKRWSTSELQRQVRGHAAARGCFRLAIMAEKQIPLLGGAEMSRQMLAEYLRSRGHTVEIIECARRGDDNTFVLWRGIPVFGAQRMRAMRYDGIIIDHDALHATAASALASGAPCWHWSHNHWQLAELAEFTKQGGRLIANCSYVAEQMRAAGMSVDALLHPLIPREIFQVAHTGKNITFINPIAIKGAEIFWQVVKLLPDTPFLLVRGRYGTQQIPDRLPPNVRVIDAVDDPREVYAQTRILLAPSQYETWLRIGYEAGWSGIPLISTHNPGVDESMGDAAIYATTAEEFAAAITRVQKTTSYHQAGTRVRERVAAMTAITLTQYAAFAAHVEKIITAMPLPGVRQERQVRMYIALRTFTLTRKLYRPGDDVKFLDGDQAELLVARGFITLRDNPPAPEVVAPSAPIIVPDAPQPAMTREEDIALGALIDPALMGGGVDLDDEDDDVSVVYPDTLKDMTTVELREMARTFGVEFNTRTSKAALIAAISEKLG